MSSTVARPHGNKRLGLHEDNAAGIDLYKFGYSYDKRSPENHSKAFQLPSKTSSVQRLAVLLMIDEWDPFKGSDMKPRINLVSSQLFVLEAWTLSTSSKDQVRDHVGLPNDLLGAQCGGGNFK